MTISRQNSRPRAELPHTVSGCLSICPVTRASANLAAAPELFSWSARDVDPTKCDMWSLACVLSEAATWMVLGYTGTRQYSRLRRTAIKKSPRNIKETDPDELHSRRITGGDRFHYRKSLLPQSSHWHT